MSELTRTVSVSSATFLHKFLGAEKDLFAFLDEIYLYSIGNSASDIQLP